MNPMIPPPLADMLPIALCYCDKVGTIVEANDELRQAIGQIDVVGKRFASLLTVGSAYIYETQILPILGKGGTVREVALDFEMAGRKSLPVLGNFNIHSGPSSQAGFVCVLMATPERRELESRLISMRRQVEQSEARFRHITETGSDIILEITEAGVINYVSPAFFTNLAIEPSTCNGQSIYDLMHPDDGEVYRLALQGLNEVEKESATTAEIRLQNRAGDWTWFLCRPRLYAKTDTPHQKAGSTYYLDSLRDITANVQIATSLAEAALAAEQASEAKSQFLANMSHEIRTPLNGVLGVASALARTELNDRQRKMVEIITGSGRTLSGLLNDILDLSKMEAGQLSLEPLELSPSELVGQVFGLFEVSAQAKGLAFELDCDIASNSVILGDPVRIKQILSNLIGNAVKFTTTGTVKVKARYEHESETRCELMFEVSDTGPGFDEDVKNRLFGRFVQADASTSRTFGGSGLGLSICKTLASMMNGQVGCHSVPGEGSVFWFKANFDVPTLDPAKAAARTATATLPPQCVVLAAEDNEVNRSVLRLLLEDSVTRLDFAVNGEDAVRAYKEKSYDIILMDTQMPVLDGIAATRLIRETEQSDNRRRTPIITLSANVMDNQIAEANAAGADAYVSKPIDPDELIAAMAQVLVESDLQSRLRS